MSPTRFGLCIDILLDKLAKTLPSSSTLRAFADDIGLSIINRQASLPIIASIFQYFGLYSSLHLNISKTHLIPFSPLFQSDLDLLHSISWDDIDSTRSKGRYLGIVIGPSATPSDTLSGILSKFEARCRHWSKTPLSASYKCKIYNMFLHPLFSYYCQFRS